MSRSMPVASCQISLPAGLFCVDLDDGVDDGAAEQPLENEEQHADPEDAAADPSEDLAPARAGQPQREPEEQEHRDDDEDRHHLDHAHGLLHSLELVRIAG